MFKKITIILLLSFASGAMAQVTYQQARKASQVIGRWISKSTGHYDFLSATPVGPKRAGDKFFIIGEPAMQRASDYGFSYMQAIRDEEVTDAYQTLGFDTSTMARQIDLTRFHLALGFANRHDFSFSYMRSTESVNGWGLAYKKVFLNYKHYFYMAYKGSFGRSTKLDYFESSSFCNEVSASLYFILYDFYLGIRHYYNEVNFKSSIPQLDLPDVYYFSDFSEIEYYYGVILATTLNTRLAIQVNQLGEEYSVGAKFSFHFDSLLPTSNNWFRDRRYIRH